MQPTSSTSAQVGVPAGAPGAPTWARALEEVFVGVAAVVVATLFAVAAEDVASISDLVMIYMGAVALASWRLRVVASVMTAVGSAVAFNVVLVDPRFALLVKDPRHILTFTLLGGVGGLISMLVSTSRAHEQVALRREAQGVALNALASRLAGARTLADAGAVAAAQVGVLLDAGVVILAVEGDRLVALGDSGAWLGDAVELLAATAAASSRGAAGASTEQVGWARLIYLPLCRELRVHGVMGVTLRGPWPDRETRRLMDTAADFVAEVFDRLYLDESARRAVHDAEEERTRATLLSSLSHDLRTPLAAITGAATTLLDTSTTLAPEVRQLLTQQIADGARRLDRLFRNVLQLTRLDRRSVRPDLEWHVPEDIVGTAIANVATLREGRRIVVAASGPPRLAYIDAVLVEQVLTNYLENALQYAPEGTIEIAIGGDDEEVQLAVSDRGRGLPESIDIFEPFVRGPGTHPGGAGLGLAICWAVAKVHCGRVWAERRAGGGVSFCVALPRGGPDAQPTPDLNDVDAMELE